MNTSTILAEVTENTRDLLYFYLSKLDKSLWYETPQFNGKTLNSVAWTLCHIAWGEDSLILKACANKSSNIAWLDNFSIGKPTIETTAIPPIEEIKEALKLIHAQSLEVITNLSDDDLLLPNYLNLDFKKGNSKKQIIYHHNRHEGVHIGQISLLCKWFDAKTI